MSIDCHLPAQYIESAIELQDVETATQLVQTGCKISEHALCRAIYHSYIAGFTQLAREMLRLYNAPLSTKPLEYATSGDHVELVNELFALKCPVSYEAVEMTVVWGNVELFSKFLEYPELQDITYCRLLFEQAVQWGRTEIAKLLINEFKRNTVTKINAFITIDAINFAIRDKNIEIIEYALEYNYIPDLESLMHAINLKRSDIAIDIAKCVGHLQSPRPFEAAIANELFDVAEELINLGFEISEHAIDTIHYLPRTEKLELFMKTFNSRIVTITILTKCHCYDPYCIHKLKFSD